MSTPNPGMPPRRSGLGRDACVPKAGGQDLAACSSAVSCPTSGNNGARMLSGKPCFFIVVLCLQCVASSTVSAASHHPGDALPYPRRLQGDTSFFSSGVDGLRAQAEAAEAEESYPNGSSIFLQDASLLPVRRGVAPAGPRPKSGEQPESPGRPPQARPIMQAVKPHQAAGPPRPVASEPETRKLGREEEKAGPEPDVKPGRVPPIYRPGVGIEDKNRLKPPAEDTKTPPPKKTPPPVPKKPAIRIGRPGKSPPPSPAPGAEPQSPPPSPDRPVPGKLGHRWPPGASGETPEPPPFQPSPETPSESPPDTPPQSPPPGKRAPKRRPAFTPPPPPSSPPPPPPLAEGEWPTMAHIQAVPVEVLQEGKRKLAELLSQKSNSEASTAAPSSVDTSLLQTVVGRLKKPVVRSSLEEEQEEARGDNTLGGVSSRQLWEKDAADKWKVKRRRNPKAFVRPADAPSNVHVLDWLDEQGIRPSFYDEEDQPQEGARSPSFLQFFARLFWSPKRGWEKALEKFWPKGTTANAKDEGGRPARLTMHETLGMGGFGVVARVEDVDARPTNPNRCFAAKFMYEFTSPAVPLKKSTANMKSSLESEVQIRDQLLQALDSNALLRGKPMTEKFAHLTSIGVAVPQLTYTLTKTVLEHQIIVSSWEFPPEVTGSPHQDNLRFLTQMVSYPLLGPDMNVLFEQKIEDAVRAYIIYKVVNILAQFEKLGFTHNDLKPENFLVRKDGEVFVADVGLVKKIGEMFPCISCTPTYLDPQSAECAYADQLSKAQSKRDAWALGATIFNVLCNNDLPYNMDALYSRAEAMDGPGHPIIRFLGFVSKLTRSDWTQDRCGSKDDNLWTIAKVLLDPIEDSRRTALDLSDHPFFKVQGV